MIVHCIVDASLYDNSLKVFAPCLGRFKSRMLEGIKCLQLTGVKTIEQIR